MQVSTCGNLLLAMERYNRQILLPEIGEAGQRKLQQAKVLIVGVGGLGCPEAIYLTAMGVGYLGLIDDDKVSLSNLGRQVLYKEEDEGKWKVECAAKYLKEQNNDVNIMTYPCRLTAENAEEIISQYDIVIDGCDNPATRYLISDTCIATGKSYIYAAIGAFTGQVAILCHGEHPCTYRTLFPDESTLKNLKANKGVIGSTPAVTGSVAANEALKLIVGFGEPFVNKLWNIDLLTLESYTIHLK